MKWDLFFHHENVKEILCNYFGDIKLGVKHKKTLMNSIYIVEIMFFKVIECCLVECFHCKFRISTQIIIHLKTFLWMGFKWDSRRQLTFYH